jgi:NAD dependent epimerase/dehydratase family enzyme
MPWVQIDDLVSQLLFAAEREILTGPFNATAPNPVTNREFTQVLGRLMRRPTFMPSPPIFMLKAIIGEFANVLLQSQRAIPQKLAELGFEYHYPELEPALREVLT